MRSRKIRNRWTSLLSLIATRPPQTLGCDHYLKPENLRIVVDDKIEIYAAWGLGTASFAHTLSPWSMYSVWKLGRTEGIWNRPTESGSRWQTAGTYAVDGDGIVRWSAPAQRADDIPDLEAAVRSVENETKREAKL